MNEVEDLEGATFSTGSFQVIYVCFRGGMNQNASQPGKIFRLLLHSASCLMVGLLLLFVALREDQGFWTNAGGYPLWLRHLVRVAYYPLLLLEAGLLVWLSCLLVCKPAPSVKLFWAEAAVLLLSWAVVALVVAWMLSNNIANLIDGRPLHDH